MSEQATEMRAPVSELALSDAVLKQIAAKVRAECDDWNWTYHMLPMVRYAVLLAEEVGADRQIVEAAAILHDLGRFRYGSADHENTGAADAREILTEHEVAPAATDRIVHCIAAHRGNGEVKPLSIEAQVIASADALAHFDIIPAMMQSGLRREGDDLVQAVRWVRQKIERDWSDKLLVPAARALAVEKYGAFRLLFDAIEPYLTAAGAERRHDQNEEAKHV